MGARLPDAVTAIDTARTLRINAARNAAGAVPRALQEIAGIRQTAEIQSLHDTPNINAQRADAVGQRFLNETETVVPAVNGATGSNAPGDLITDAALNQDMTAAEFVQRARETLLSFQEAAPRQYTPAGNVSSPDQTGVMLNLVA